MSDWKSQIPAAVVGAITGSLLSLTVPFVTGLTSYGRLQQRVEALEKSRAPAPPSPIEVRCAELAKRIMDHPELFSDHPAYRDAMSDLGCSRIGK